MEDRGGEVGSPPLSPKNPRVIAPSRLALETPTSVPLWAAAPFALLLLSIALGPLVAKHAWHRHYPKVALALGGLVAGAYVLAVPGFGIEGRRTEALAHPGAAG